MSEPEDVIHLSGLVSQREAAQILGISPAGLRALVHRGRLQVQSLPGSRPVLRSSLDRLIAEKSTRHPTSSRRQIGVDASPTDSPKEK